MPEEINQQKNEEQYSDLLNALSPEAKRIILSEDTAISIAGICLENDIEDEEKIEKTAYQATMVLLGRISQDDFSASLEKELQIDGNTAKKISDEINEVIFSQIKKTQAGETQQKESAPTNSKKLPTISRAEKSQESPKRNDAYKEPLE